MGATTTCYAEASTILSVFATKEYAVMKGKQVCLTILASLISICFAQAQSRCPGEGNHTSGEKVVHLWTGPQDGYYDQVGKAIAATSKHRADEVNVDSCQSKGSADNVAALLKGEADFAIVQSDVAHQLWHCERRDARRCFEEKEASRIRLVTPLFIEKAQVLLRPHLYVSSLSDLRGSHCIWIGAAGSGSEPTAKILLEAAGWSGDQIAASQLRCQRSPKDLREALMLLHNGEDLDAIIQTRVSPSPEILEALKESEIQLLGIDWATVQRMTHDGIYRETSIQRSEYPSLSEGVYSIGVQALLLTRNDEDADAIRELAELIQNKQADIEHHLQRNLLAVGGGKGEPDVDSPAMLAGEAVGPATLTLVGSKFPEELEAYVDPEAKPYLWYWGIRRGTVKRMAVLLAALVALGTLLGLRSRGRVLASVYCRELLFASGGVLVWIIAAMWLQAIEGDLNEHFTTLWGSSLSLAENVMAKLPVQLSFAPTPTTRDGVTLVSAFTYAVVSLLAVYFLPWLRKTWQWFEPRLFGVEPPPAASVTPPRYWEPLGGLSEGAGHAKADRKGMTRPSLIGAVVRQNSVRP
jgi:uncharacterized protein